MDPTEALKQILVAVAEGRADDARDTLLDLVAWHEKGGFAPDAAKAITAAAAALGE